ncbi:MAG: PHP domain-containing protein [Endomicrobium sp.]|nr:PHP domain-containing protein [Endomicrobium sp.]
MHTNCSDGVFTSKEAVEYAYKIKLAAISITDHNSVDGIEEALKAASKIGPEVIPGIELSSEVMSDPTRSGIHILGYCINYKSEELKSVLSVFKKARHQRVIKILEKLKQNGIELKDKSFLENAGNKAIGRLHFAKALVAENIAESIQQAFQRCLAQNRPASMCTTTGM